MEKKFTQKADTIANLEHVENVNTEHVHARIDHANTVNFYGAQKQPSRFLQKIRKFVNYQSLCLFSDEVERI